MIKKNVEHYLDEALIDFIVMSILLDAHRIEVLSKQDQIFLNNLCLGLNVSQSRLFSLRQKVDSLSYPKIKANQLNLKAFFMEIFERSSHQHDISIAQNIVIKIHELMQCEQVYSSNQLRKNIRESSKPSSVKSSNLEVEKVIQRTTDEECRELLIEVSEKDWSSELDNFRKGIISLKVAEFVDAHISKNQEKGLHKGAYIGTLLAAVIGLFLGKDLILIASLIAMLAVCTVSLVLMSGIGALLSAVLVIVGIILYSSILLPLMASGSLIISKIIGVVACATIGSAVGAGLGVKYMRYKLLQRKSELEKPQFESLKEYVLMPNDLLRFWENKVEIYLRERKSRIQLRIREASRTRAECLKILDELKDLDDSIEAKTKLDLKSQVKHMGNIIVDAQNVNVVLQKLEDSFASKIEELRALVNKQEKYERDQYRLQEIEGKIRKVIGKSRSIREDWLEEKKNLQIQIEGMMNAFQNQLLHTKDFVHAEIILKSPSESKSIEHIET